MKTEKKKRLTGVWFRFDSSPGDKRNASKFHRGTVRDLWHKRIAVTWFVVGKKRFKKWRSECGAEIYAALCEETNAAILQKNPVDMCRICSGVVGKFEGYKEDGRGKGLKKKKNEIFCQEETKSQSR